jgi:ABC-type hemin transport system ATPase subunit
METITGEMLRRVFDIETSVGDIPAPGVPFVLPQAMTAAKWFSIF